MSIFLMRAPLLLGGVLVMGCLHMGCEAQEPNLEETSSNAATMPAEACVIDQALLDAAFAEGVASVDITTDNQASYDEGVASVDITTDNQAAYAEGVASVDITTDNQASYDEGVASVDITTDNQASYDEGYLAGVTSVDITTDNQASYDEGYLAGKSSIVAVEGANIVEDTCAPNLSESVEVTEDTSIQPTAQYDASKVQEGVDSIDLEGEKAASYEEGYAAAPTPESNDTEVSQAAYAQGAESVDITTDNQASYDQGHGDGYAVGWVDGAASIAPWECGEGLITCDDGCRNPLTDPVYCGGCENACADGALCIEGGCVSCNDAIQNGDEIDVDCGGSLCEGCASGAQCAWDTDCISLVCTGNECQAATCSDGVSNAAETGVDCGGSVCGACADGGECSLASDCQSAVCPAGLCEVPNCSDGVQNATETDVDCAGDCGPCANDAACGGDADCESLSCIAGTCTEPTCDDNYKNGDETAVDCGGGTCPGCPIAQACLVDSDCLNNACLFGVCKVDDWEMYNPVYLPFSLNAVDFVDALLGWAAGWGGSIIRTQDGGLTWEQAYTLYSAEDDIFFDVAFGDALMGCAVQGPLHSSWDNQGFVGGITCTDDGGETWSSRLETTGGGNHPWRIDMQGQTGLAATDGQSHLYRSSDGGQSWSTVVPDSEGKISDVGLVTEVHGLAVGYVEGIAAVFETLDGGESWTRTYDQPTNQGLQRVAALDTSNAWAFGSPVGLNSPVLKYDGETWAPLPCQVYELVQTPSTFSDEPSSCEALLPVAQVSFADAANGVLARRSLYDGREWFVTDDGGATWYERVSNAFPRDMVYAAGPEGDEGRLVAVSGSSVYILPDNMADTEFMMNPPAVPNGQAFGDFYEIQFLTQNTGVALADSPWLTWWIADYALVWTYDGGETWVEKPIPGALGVYPRGMDCTSVTHCWLAGEAGVIIRTADGGDTWTHQETAVEGLTSIDMLDEMTGWAVGQFGTIMHTSDGVTWVEQDSGVGSELNDVTFFDAQSGWAVGANQTVIRTTDGGQTWNEFDLNASTPNCASCLSGVQSGTLTQIHFVTPTHGWIRMGYGYYATVDGGVTWAMVIIEDTHDLGIGLLEDLFFIDESQGYLVGRRGIATTTDGGASWVAQIVGLQLWDMAAVPSTSEVWAVGPAGLMFRRQ
jgi:photosystem II stability/assembly factor-like uncharacterized protein